MSNEPCCEKTDLQGSDSHTSYLRVLKSYINTTRREIILSRHQNTKEMFSLCGSTVDLHLSYVYAKCRFSHDAAKLRQGTSKQQNELSVP